MSKDLGSGQALVPVIKKIRSEKKKRIEVISSGLSCGLFRDKDIAYIDSDNDDFNGFSNFKPDLIITGASMRASIEKKAILHSKKIGIPCITILDYWGKYWDRFSTDGNIDQAVLPDFICVPDITAKDDMIIQNFPPDKLIVTGNPYFDTFKEHTNRKKDIETKTILFISQPEFVNGRYKTDLEKIKDVNDLIQKKDMPVRLIVKLHPKESRENYESIKTSGKVIVRWKEGLDSLLKESDIIIGADSTAMFESVFSGKSVISYQPELEGRDLLITNKLGLSSLVRTKFELELILENMVEGETNRKKTETFKYLNDGFCGERVVDLINSITM